MNLKLFSKCLDAIDLTLIEKLSLLVKNNNDKIILLGNGGSSSICSHIAQDYTKVLGKNALTFSDASRLTCYANDYGWDNAYSKFLEQFGTKDSLYILISSSGNSNNILNAAHYCKSNSLDLITLSGFSNNNLLKKNYENYSKLHFYVDSNDYGIVECLHSLILHSII
jgi:D-sedoheptulose 7-phosphate isomerase